MPARLSMTVNGKPVNAEVEPRTLLVDFIRDTLHLTGTHIGCDTAQCGACTIHMNGKAVKCCNMLAVQAEGHTILTIEGIAKADGSMHPMQAAFRDHHGLQCGYCTPGMVMSAIDLLKRHPNPSEDQIRAELDGNLCRCTGYHNIVKAVQAAAQKAKENRSSTQRRKDREGRKEVQIKSKVHGMPVLPASDVLSCFSLRPLRLCAEIIF